MRDRADAAMARVEPERLVDEINKLNDQLDAQDAEIARLRAVIEDAIETLEAMDLYAGNPLYNRLVLAMELNNQQKVDRT